MKKIVSIFLCILIASLSHSQEQWAIDQETFQFAKQVSVAGLKGKNFRYEMAVRSENQDSVPGLVFYGVASGNNGNLSATRFLKTEKRIEQEWTVLTIIGKVPENATSLWFLASVNVAGTFYFDDISCFVEKQPGSWRQLEISNSSFEEGNRDTFAGYLIIKEKSGNPKTALSGKIYKTGKQSLMIRLTNYPDSRNFVSGE
jgi:hypothetical protein